MTPLTDEELTKLELHNARGVATSYEVERLLAEVKAQRRLLQAAEWSTGLCGWCDRVKQEGHAKDCLLGRYLAACKTKDAPSNQEQGKSD